MPLAFVLKYLIDTIEINPPEEQGTICYYEN